jgi:hypothetical protein
MADRYWVGGTAAWDGTAGTKWALTSGGAGGQAVPTASDDVFLDAASGAVTVTIQTINGNAKSLNCTGFTGTLAGGGVIIANGNLTLGAGMGFTSTGQWQFGGTGTITSNGVVFTASISLNGTGQTVTLGDAYISTGTVAVTRGTFTTSASNYSFTAARLTSTGTITRQIDLNGSTVTLSDGWEAGAATGLTFNAGTSSIVLTGQGANVTSNGHTFNNVSLTSTSSGESVFSGAGTFATLSIAAPSSPGVIRANFSGNQTITTFVASGTSSVNRILLASNEVGTARTINATTWTTVSDVDFRDITLTNAKSGTRLGDAGGNTGVTFDPPKTVYWNLSGAQNWSATGWATSSGGSPSINNFPLAQDTAVFDENGAITNITVNSLWNITTVDMAARTSAMTFTCAGSNRLTFYGNLVTGSGTTFSGTARFVFSGRVPQIITSAGKTITQVVEIASAGSTVTLQDALTMSGTFSPTLALVSGTFDANGYNVTLTAGSFNGNGTSVRALAIGSGTWTIGGASWSTTGTGLTVTGNGVISMSSVNQKTFSRDVTDYSGITLNQAGAGLLVVFTATGVLGNINNTYASTGATAIRFNGDQTLENFTASGQAGRVLTITSSINGVARTLTKTSGVVSVNHLDIRDSTATGGADWYAGANSVNTSNNTGWIFANAPGTGGGGNFLAFFM